MHYGVRAAIGVMHNSRKPELCGVGQMRVHGRTLLAVAALLALSSCATSTPYQPETPGQRVHGKVTFDGNSLTSRERVEGYMLYRAAELTVQNGFDWFRVVDRLTERDQRTYTEPRYNPWYGYGYWRPYWRYYRPRYGWYDWYPYGGSPFWADEIDTRTVEEFEAHAEITMHRGVPPVGESAFDARKVMADLGPTIERPKDR
jgi:hypothetical protein